jgi:ferredoxin/flavodoxin---NADP+ reductase
VDDAEPYDIVIIGAGPTGLFGAFYAGLRGMRTLILDSLPEPGGQVSVLYPEKYVYDAPGFTRILGRDLVQHLHSQAMRFSPDLHLEEPVRALTRINDQYLYVETSRRSYLTRSVLICAGVGRFMPNRLPAQGAERFEGGSLVYAVREKGAYSGQHVLVVGGGDSAVDWAIGLQEVGAQVTLVHRRDQFRAHERSVAELRASPVRVMLSCEVQALHGHESIEAATLFNHATQATEQLAADTVVGCLGFKADTSVIKSWGLQLDQKRGISIDANCQTSMPRVYAAGAIAGGPVQLDLLAVHFGQAAIAINSAKVAIDPQAGLSPGHSSDMHL